MWKAKLSATHALQYQYATVFFRFFACPVGCATYGFHLPDRSFYLPRAVGQPLVSVPGWYCMIVFVGFSTGGWYCMIVFVGSSMGGWYCMIVFVGFCTGGWYCMIVFVGFSTGGWYCMIFFGAGCGMGGKCHDCL